MASRRSRSGSGTDWRIAVFLLSAAAVAYEVLLVRLFSIIQWHHFATMVISLALLGYGASGTLLSLLRNRFCEPAAAARAFATCALGFGLTSLGCFLAAQRLPFNPLDTVWNPRQLQHLLALYMLLAVPFLAAGCGIGLALSRAGPTIAGVYRADLLGAGFGAAGIVAALFLLSPVRILALVGLLGAAAALPPMRAEGSRRLAAVALAVAVAVTAPWWLPESLRPSLRASEYKDLSKTLLLPDARIVEERSSPMGLLTLVESPTVPFRHAPGLSPAFDGDLPDQYALFEDGDAVGFPGRVDPGEGRLPYLDFLPAALPYHLTAVPEVLILGAGAGSEISAALSRGAVRVEVVEPDRRRLELLRRALGDGRESTLDRPEVRVHVVDPRSFIRRTARTFDLIVVTGSATGSSSGAGSMGWSSESLLTLEALEAVVALLRPGGLLAITRRLELPPRGALKLFGTLIEVLERSSVERPGGRLAMIRTWSLFTLLLKNGDLTAADLEAIRRFSSARFFDLAYLPDLVAGEGNRFHLLERPYLFDGAAAMLGPERRSFLRDYKFDLRLATDDRPFFSHTFRWRALSELLRLRTRGGAALLEWGYPLAVLTLLQAILVAAILILLPIAALDSTGERPGGGRGRVCLFFASLGLGFLLLEIAFIQKLTLLLGHPVYAVSLALSGFLVFAGLGSGLTRSLGLRRLEGPLIGIAALAGIYAFLLPPMFQSAAALAAPMRAVLALLLIAPVALLMGMPFPMGLSRLDRYRRGWIPWAWAINGSASVVGAALAPVLAVHLGFGAVLVGGGGLYLAALAGASGLPSEGGRRSGHLSEIRSGRSTLSRKEKER